MAENAGLTRLGEAKRVEVFPGVFRVTMAYNDASMLCHFTLKAGASIPLHQHEAVQNGFVIEGKIRFLREGGKSFVVEEGDGYIFESNEKHGGEVLEDSKIIECFTPMREDYLD